MRMISPVISTQLNLHLTDKGELALNFELSNGLNQDLDHWVLWFDLPKEVRAGNDTQWISRTGSHVCLAPNKSQAWEAGQTQCLQIIGLPNIICRYSDLPNGLYVQSAETIFELMITGDNLASLDKASVRPSSSTNNAQGYGGAASINIDETPKSANAGVGNLLPMA